MRRLLLTGWKLNKAEPRVSFLCYNQREICTTGMKISICVAINRRLMRICSQYIRLLRSTFRGDRISVQTVFFINSVGS